MNQLIKTSDGSHTIFVPGLNEYYHSIYGAVQESEYIFISKGMNVSNADPLNIFEVGFGTGLNALLTAANNINIDRQVIYTSIEKYPVEKKIIDALNHHFFAGENGRRLIQSIHSSPWNKPVDIIDNFTLHKINDDLTEIQLSGSYDLIYFDAFAPEKQPEMWSNKVFSSIASVTKKGGILVTYSAKGEVKRKLRECGFNVTLLPGPPGKRQIIRAIKN